MKSRSLLLLILFSTIIVNSYSRPVFWYDEQVVDTLPEYYCTDSLIQSQIKMFFASQSDQSDRKWVLGVSTIDDMQSYYNGCMVLNMSSFQNYNKFVVADKLIGYVKYNDIIIYLIPGLAEDYFTDTKSNYQETLYYTIPDTVDGEAFLHIVFKGSKLIGFSAQFEGHHGSIGMIDRVLRKLN